MASSVSEDPVSLPSEVVGEAMHQGPGSGDRGSRENCWAAVTSGGPRRPQSPRARPSTPCPPAGHRRVHPACPLGTMCPATSLAAGDGHREPLARAAWSQHGREGQRTTERVDGWLEGGDMDVHREGGRGLPGRPWGPRSTWRVRRALTAVGTRSGLRSHSPRVSLFDARPPSLAVPGHGAGKRGRNGRRLAQCHMTARRRGPPKCLHTPS